MCRDISVELDKRFPAARTANRSAGSSLHLSRFRTFIRLVVYHAASSSRRKVISAKYDFRGTLKFPASSLIYFSLEFRANECPTRKSCDLINATDINDRGGIDSLGIPFKIISLMAV